MRYPAADGLGISEEYIFTLCMERGTNPAEIRMQNLIQA
jgi:hypothetical protein